MTKNIAGMTDASRASLGFSALVFALFGWINLEVVLFATNAGIRAHLMSFASGIVLSALAYRRCRVWMTLTGGDSAGPPHSTSGLIGSALALTAAGCALAYSMRTGFVIPTVICAAVLCLFPWSRSRFCYRYFFASHALLIAGWLPVMLTHTTHPSLIMVLACTYCIWALAAGAMLVTLSKQQSNSVRSAPGKVEQNA